eukprot:CAMPEP_0181312292 /NCGR_PEP_ID=MMETSP1101-20121128/13617_1 /TAXON_ID=46948 /ORGANISM="Rhodomonas abbreviata, Strain Caron Lab Isolate" /LENGTH=47 /DNA_ID= /DNA_START= /DNA_END= /DNA_ORIENTATION=
MFGSASSAAFSGAASSSSATMSPASTREYLKSNDYRAQLGMPAGFGM